MYTVFRSTISASRCLFLTARRRYSVHNFQHCRELPFMCSRGGREPLPSIHCNTALQDRSFAALLFQSRHVEVHVWKTCQTHCPMLRSEVQGSTADCGDDKMSDQRANALTSSLWCVLTFWLCLCFESLAADHGGTQHGRGTPHGLGQDGNFLWFTTIFFLHQDDRRGPGATAFLNHPIC